MQYIFLHYYRMIFLRANPQDCPVSNALQLSLLLLYFVVSVVTALSLYNLWSSIAHTIIELALLYIFAQILLINSKERIHQTFSAFLGSGALIGIVSAILSHLVVEQRSEESISVADFVLFSILFAWLVIVYGHIVRHAINVNFSSGIGIVIAYALITIILRQSISTTLGI